VHALLHPLSRWLRTRLAGSASGRPGKLRVPPAQFEANLQRILVRVRELGNRGIVLTYPYPGTSRGPLRDEYAARARAAAREHPADLIDLATTLGARDELFQDYCHPNRAGNAEIAALLADRLVARDGHPNR
jgi:lysophospholipase L1-like esterase